MGHFWVTDVRPVARNSREQQLLQSRSGPKAALECALVLRVVSRGQNPDVTVLLSNIVRHCLSALSLLCLGFGARCSLAGL